MTHILLLIYLNNGTSEQWDLCSFAKLFDESVFIRENCLYLYKEGLQNIIKSTNFDDEQKAKANAFLDTYEVQIKQSSTILEALENKSNSCSAKSTIFQDRSWRAQYGDTCLKASARDCNAQKDIGLLRLLNESLKTIQDFLWNNDDMSKTSQKMTTRMIYSPLKCAKKSRTTAETKHWQSDQHELISHSCN
ncbi:hypothetical protein C2G38_2144057 [Gigaspora rosea]|uniref:Uncharacterized protein n=1 Tax=Gigaspora rosea TaxID=44941 RepID=A0A397V0B1_9GLOM|nr:hypothetical protein C2G38_2144057 [Gigaspora rosea]